MYKIIGVDGRQYGPVTADQIQRWIAEHRMRADTLIQPEGTQDWRPLNSFPEFAAFLQSAPPASPGLPPVLPSGTSSVTARASNKIPAGVCGILLGGLGVHKFILGYTGPGLVLLLITILSCGIAGAVTGIIGLIEGIIYLTKTDEEFVRTYVDGRRDWF